MNTKQKNTLYMLKRVEKSLETHKAVWEGEAKMVSTVKDFLVKKEEIDLLFSEKEKLSAPFADVKKSRLDEYASKIAKLAGFLFIIGDENDINELKVYSDITETQLLGGSLQFLFSNAQKILDITKDHLDAIKEFSNGEALVKECIELHEATKDNGLDPYDRRELLKSLNLKLKDAFAEIKKMLTNRLDRLVRFFSDVDKGFVSDYKSSRKIINIPATRSVSEDTGTSPPEDDKESDIDSNPENSSGVIPSEDSPDSSVKDDNQSITHDDSFKSEDAA